MPVPSPSWEVRLGLADALRKHIDKMNKIANRARTLRNESTTLEERQSLEELRFSASSEEKRSAVLYGILFPTEGTPN